MEKWSRHEADEERVVEKEREKDQEAGGKTTRRFTRVEKGKRSPKERSPTLTEEKRRLPKGRPSSAPIDLNQVPALRLVEKKLLSRRGVLEPQRKQISRWSNL